MKNKELLTEINRSKEIIKFASITKKDKKNISETIKESEEIIKEEKIITLSQFLKG